MAINQPELIRILNSIFKEDKWVITGGLAIYLLAKATHVELPTEIIPHNIDIFYHYNTPLTINSFSNYIRGQNTPCSSMSFHNSENRTINLTLKRSRTRYIKLGSFNIMNPETLLKMYELDDDDMDFDKMTLNVIKYTKLKEIISKLPNYPIYTMEI